MEKIKTYPLQFTESELNRIKNEALKRGMSIKEFMHQAISESMNKEVR